MKKIVFFSLILNLCLMAPSAFSQSNDEKAISFLDQRLQKMFKVLHTKSDTISPTCMDSLKKLHDFKEQMLKTKDNTDIQKDTNIAIVRALYSNSIQFCGTDVQNLCSHRVDPSIRSICKELQPQN